MRICFVVCSHFKGLVKYLNYVGSIGSRNKIERAAYLLDKLVPTGGDLLIPIDFVGNDEARNMGAVTPHFSVPVPKVRISNFALRVEH
jgi:hypothetical protein